MRDLQFDYDILNFINLGNTNGCVELFVREMEDHCELIVNKFNVYGSDGKQLKPRLMYYNYLGGRLVAPDSNNTFILDKDWNDNGEHIQILKMRNGSYLITQLYGVDDKGHFQNIRCETPIGQTGTYTMYNGLNYGIDEKATVISPILGKDYAGDIVIPETIKYNGSTVPVSCIGMDAFTNTSVTSVKIEPANIAVNYNSFSNTAHLRSLDMSAIKLPEDQSMLEFREICSNCPELTEVLLPACPATFRYSFINDESLSTIRLVEGSELYEPFTGTNTYSAEIVPVPESVGNPESKVALRIHNNGLLRWNGEPLPLTLYINKVINNNRITIMPDIYGDIMVFNRDNFYNIRNNVTIYSGKVYIMCSDAYVNGSIGYVSFSEEQLAGVDSPQVEVSEAPARYYNLQGMEVDAEHLVPGIYIRRTADSASKVLVR